MFTKRKMLSFATCVFLNLIGFSNLSYSSELLDKPNSIVQGVDIKNINLAPSTQRLPTRYKNLLNWIKINNKWDEVKFYLWENTLMPENDINVPDYTPENLSKLLNALGSYRSQFTLGSQHKLALNLGNTIINSASPQELEKAFKESSSHHLAIESSSDIHDPSENPFGNIDPKIF